MMTAPCPLAVVRRQPWRGVRRRQPGGPRHPIHHHRHQPYKHACTVSAHTEPAAEQSETAPGPPTGSLARRQPWRGVRRRQQGGPRHPIQHQRHHHPYKPYKHACTVSAHDTEPEAEQSETAPGPLTGSLARRQPWRGVRRRQPGGPRHPIQYHRHQPYKHACTGSAHSTEPAAEPSETAPGPLTGSLASRQPWRGVRR
jgi:hypothetical protein